MGFAALPAWPKGKSRNSTKSRRGSSRGGNPALPIIPDFTQGQGAGSCSCSKSQAPVCDPAFPAVFQLAKKSHGRPSLTDTRSKMLLPSWEHPRLSLGSCWVAFPACKEPLGSPKGNLGTKPRSCLSIHPSGKVSQGNGAAPGGNPGRGMVMGGEGPQPLWARLRAAELGSPRQEQHAALWGGWQKGA